jgi:hypothetical protein
VFALRGEENAEEPWVVRCVPHRRDFSIAHSLLPIASGSLPIAHSPLLAQENAEDTEKAEFRGEEKAEKDRDFERVF